MAFNEIAISEENLLPFKMIGKDWFLVTAGKENDFNTMTAGWGGMGVMWGKDMFLAAIRPTRYTYDFIEKEEYFSICFFDSEHKDVLSYCGKTSGRNEDKVKGANITPVFFEGVPAFEEASMILICKKVYRQPLDENCFIDKSNLKWYNNDFHIMYGGEIIKAYKKA